MGSRDNLLVERKTRDRKDASSVLGRSGERIFFSGVNFLCWLLFGVRSSPCYRSGTLKTNKQTNYYSVKSVGG